MRNQTEDRTAENLVDAAGERAKCCVDASVDALNAVTGKARKIGDTADGYVRENPWLVIGAVAGIAALVGFLFRGRR